MKGVELLRAFREEREALLRRILEVLRQDERVLSVWLSGSLGRGGGDDLSDLDLWVVIRDEDLDRVRRERRRLAAAAEEPLLRVEAPQNAPARGAYLMAVYPGRTAGPFQVDWYWQSQSAAVAPQDGRVLLEKVGLPQSPGPAGLPALAGRADDASDEASGPPCQPAEEARNRVSLFWAMLLISARYVTRQREDEPLFAHAMLRDLLRGSASEVGLRAPSIAEPDTPSPVRDGDKLATLRGLAGAMEDLMPRIAAAGVEVPGGIVQPACRYLDAVQVIVAEKMSP